MTTGTGTVTAALLANGSASILYGVYAASLEAAGALNIKLYWEGTGTAPPTLAGQQKPTVLPVAGTNSPQLVISVPTTGLVLSSPVPLNNGGRIWYWVSSLPGLTDTTALVTGGDVITFVFD